VLVAGRFGKGLFIYSGFRYFKESREQGLGVYRRLLEQELRKHYQPALFVDAPGLIDSIYYTHRGETRVVLLNAGSDRPAGDGNHVNIEEFIPLTVTIRSGQPVAAAFDLLGNPLPLTTSDGSSIVRVAVTGAYAGVRLVMATQ
jgi:hypothetical protein